MDENPVNVLLVDDHPVFLEGIQRALTAAGMQVVGVARDGRQGVEAAAELRPDVVVMDLSMQPMDGVEATRRIVAAGLANAVLILTSFGEQDRVFAALQAGARGYMLKLSDTSEIVRAVEAVAAGTAIFDASIAGRLLEHFATEQGTASPVLPQLTVREREILQYVAMNRHNQEIARELGLAPKTVRNHVSNILTKLQVSSRTQAARVAREAGLRSPRR
jgi:DNA-binding NarL/FixJ family response regulator